MNLTSLEVIEETVLEMDSALYQNIEQTLFRIVKGTSKGMQEVYDAFYGNVGFRSAFLKYKDGTNTVNVGDEADPEQLYIKGLVDGMRVFQTFMNVYGRSNDRFNFDEDNEEVQA
ncbi:hypothetical protein [Bacillus sp. Hm123]|uniref:hypothetical protein n=1 Tax=Bacillus sp. Hm123 TaxID=3450745 RepID=UPI003F43FB0D